MSYLIYLLKYTIIHTDNKNTSAQRGRDTARPTGSSDAGRVSKENGSAQNNTTFKASAGASGKTLTLKNDETELVLERAAENSAKVR